MEEQVHKQSVGQAAPIGHREHPGEVSNALFIVSFHFFGMIFFLQWISTELRLR
jgi:hypothetical protein